MNALCFVHKRPGPGRVTHKIIPGARIPPDLFYQELKRFYSISSYALGIASLGICAAPGVHGFLGSLVGHDPHPLQLACS